MVRASSLARPALAFAVALAAVGAAVAGDSAGNDGRKSSSFGLLFNSATPHTPVAAPSAGVGLAPGKPVVRDPYKVPMMQNAGTLHFGR